MTALRGALAAVMTVVALTSGAGLAGAAPQPIGPNQHFVGLVNGSQVNAIVKTACAGPVSPGRQGPVAGGQHMRVASTTTGRGYTGLFSQIYAWIVPATAATTAPIQLKFTTYNVAQLIPTTVRVPCGGTGKVEFSSCPYRAPCAYGRTPAYVTVKFVNMAVSPYSVDKSAR